MSEAKRMSINANAAVGAALATAVRGTQTVHGKGMQLYEAHGDKLTQFTDKASPYASKVSKAAEIFWTLLGLVLLVHGSQFKNLFLCSQVVVGFCFGRVKSSIVELFSDMKTAHAKLNEDESTEPKDEGGEAENKHAQKRKDKKDTKDDKSAEKKHEEDVATAKKVLKVVNADKVTGAVFEVCVTAMACHMVMEGGLPKVAVVTHVLVKTSKDRIKAFLDFSEHDDLKVWLDLFLSLVLYSFFGGLTVVLSPMAFALNLAMIGSQLMVNHGLKLAEQQGKIPGGETAETFAASVKGFGLFATLATFGTLWQFWAMMADSGVAWYFQMMYLPAYIAESIVSLM